MNPLHKASRLSGGYIECNPRRGSPRSGREDCHDEVDVLPEPIVERCAHCEQEVASKGEGRTRGAALSPWRPGRKEGEAECTTRWSKAEKGPRWLELSHMVARWPARSARRPHVAVRSRAMLFVSLHHGHARGTFCFLPVRPVQWGLPVLSVLFRFPAPRFVAPTPPPQSVAATGHPLLSRHSLPCQTAQHRPRTPPLPPPTPVEEAPFVGARSPCF